MTRELGDTAMGETEAASPAPTQARAQEVLAVTGSAPLMPAPTPSSRRPKHGAGVTIGRYELLRSLGQGGMGTVFLARDTKLGRLVALKLLTEIGGTGAARFLVEARATARCKHENIVIIYEVGEHDGHPFMVLEYIEGQSLETWMRERRIERDADHGHVTIQSEGIDASDGREGAVTPETDGPVSVPVSLAVELMLPVVRALICAHKLGIVHRDLKPSNIMLDESGPIKVLDFGIAKMREQDAAEPRVAPLSDDAAASGELGLTAQGAMLGTIPYMSPEQWGRDDVDARSDIWSVGIMLFELVTGAHPLAPLTYRTLGQVICLDEPMPSVLTRRPDLGPLGAVIDGCLKKRKDERIGSAEELCAALEALLPGQKAFESGDSSGPFTGLAAFQEADAARFFGRERDVNSMMSRLRTHALLAVTGPSGAGKSSFVRAGLIPALKRSGEAWEALVVRPGPRSLAALAELCAQIEPGGEEVRERLSLLREVPGMLGATLRVRSRRTSQRILLFVDQFEELYTLGESTDERKAFLACLSGAADDPSSPLRVVISVRSDFLDRMTEDRAFMAAVTRGLVFLPPLGRDDLRAALVRPAAGSGHSFETSGLVEAMLDALEEAVTPLPLLQFTAARLWETRDRERRLLTRASYDAIGGAFGALTTHADAVMSASSAREQRLTRAIFLRLVTPERTRAVVSLPDLRDLDPDGDAIEQVVFRLAEARLLAIETSEERAFATVELVHESLIERWPRLGRWLEESQEEAEFLARVRPAARQWEASGEAEGLLWRDQAAEEARRFQRRQGPSASAALGSREARYLTAVVGLAARQRRRRRRFVAFSVTSLAGIVLIFLALGLHAQRAAALAEEQSARADAERTEAEKSAAHARNSGRISAARGRLEDPTTALALLREIEPGPLPHGWDELVQWARSAGVAPVVLLHDGQVFAATFSPDGRRVASASEDKTVRVWNADGSGQPLVLRGHEAGVIAAAFSPDGRRVASASDDKTVRVWNADGSGQPLVLRGHDDEVAWASWSPDGDHIVSASRDKTVRVWRADGAGEPLVLRGHESEVTMASWSADGERIVSSSSDKTVRVWSADGSGEPLVLRGHEAEVLSASFSPDGRRIASASSDRTIRVWRADGSGEPLVLRGHGLAVYTAAFSPDGGRIVSASMDRTIRVWSADGSGQPRVLRGHDSEVVGATFSPDGKRVVSVSLDKTAKIWRVDGSVDPLVLEGHEAEVYAAAFSPDGGRIASASADRTARVWSADGTTPPLVLSGHESEVRAVAWSPDGHRVATASADKTVRLWSADGESDPQVLHGHEAEVNAVAWSPDGARVASASRDKTVRVWSADVASEPLVLRGHQSDVYGVAWSPDGRHIVSSSNDETVRVWSADGAGEPLVLRGHEKAVYGVAYSPDGRQIVSGSADNTVRIWRVDGTYDPVVLRGHESTAIISSAWPYSPDGSRIVSSSEDGTVRLWNADGLGEALVLRTSGKAVNSASWSRDGRHVVAALNDKTVVVWSDLTPFQSADDPRLWAATTYCMPLEVRQRLLDFPEEQANRDLERCLERVRALRAPDR